MKNLRSYHPTHKGHFALILIIALVIGVSGFSLSPNKASASLVTSFSATASSSVPGVGTNYMISFTLTSGIAVGQTAVIQFSAGNSGGSDEFSLASLANNDVIGLQNLTIITGGCGVVTPNQFSVLAGISDSAGNRSVTLTACGAITANTKTIGFTNSHVVNPATPGSYDIALGGTGSNTGTTMVAVVNQVTTSAQVTTSLNFSVAGVASGQAVNGTTTSTTSSATAISFGTLSPNIIYTAAQDLAVTTNAQNGYVVTVHEDQNLLSSNGADIDTFKDGSNLAVPAAWTAPTATLGNENTYGHFGLTSDDSDLNGGEFISNKWAGNFFSTTTRAVLSNNGPADGTTQDKGKARVGYQIQISALQEAANDYTNHLIYVCTPTF